jgi:hypothetical protein
LEAVKEKAKGLKLQSEKKALKKVVPIHKAEDFKTHLASDKLVLLLVPYLFLFFALNNNKQSGGCRLFCHLVRTLQGHSAHVC